MDKRNPTEHGPAHMGFTMGSPQFDSSAGYDNVVPFPRVEEEDEPGLAFSPWRVTGYFSLPSERGVTRHRRVLALVNRQLEGRYPVSGLLGGELILTLPVEDATVETSERARDLFGSVAQTLAGGGDPVPFKMSIGYSQVAADAIVTLGYECPPDHGGDEAKA